MIWPSLCVDNFLNEPEKIVEFSKTLKYNNDTRGWWPGLRSQPLHLADYEIYNKLCKGHRYRTKYLIQGLKWPTIQKISSSWRLKF